MASPSGYSALSYFATLDPDIVKLDMGLVRGIDTSEVRPRTVVIAGLPS